MNQGFSKFVNYALRVIFSIIAVGVVGMLGMYMFFQNSIVNIPLIAVYVCFTLLFIYALRKKIDCKIILGVIIAGGFLLRIMWCFSIKNYPASDYKTIYDSAQLFLQGNKSMFFGTSYFARFPHLIIFVMYVASVIKMFGSQSLIVLKLINVIFSTISIYMIYRIAEEIFKDKKKSMVTVFIAALFPASIIYTAVYCTENIAILFYLISVYIFILVMNNKKNDKYLILSGLMLLIGHLFRMAAQVVICAYILYILIYFRKKVKEKANEKGFSYVLDGMNQDDLHVYRPGRKACEELGILSPLKIMDKAMIRQYSKELGIVTYNKPANACLASRFPYDTLLTKEKLERIDRVESLLHQAGVYHVRCRDHNGIARIEVEKKDFLKIINHQVLIDQIKELGFDYVTLDLNGISSGSFDK